ncbi:MAG: Rrf2 family transcriptional regulator [Candidatus Omnitrophica bacterium]|nr:Rrf2 family transcriptional regulator [Candidatus Omnitrophota bacterium]
MKLFTRNTDYGIRALCFIAKKDGDIVSVSELVRALKIPKPFLRKILQSLTGKGFVRSYKGVGGGFALKMSANKLYIMKVAKAFQGPLSLTECLLKKELCPNRRICPLKERIDKIEKYMMSELDSITIAELIKSQK